MWMGDARIDFSYADARTCRPGNKPSGNKAAGAALAGSRLA
jgi:hypothetical protein